MYKMIKKYILKPGFLLVYKISPTLAIYAKNFIYYDKIKSYKTKKSDGQARLLVDVSVITNNDAKTGIQRVVNAVSQELYHEKKDRLEFIQVIYGKLITSYKYLSRLEKTSSSSLTEEQLTINEGDILLLLDATWDREKFAEKEIKKIRVHNGKVYGIIFDLFPIQYPELFASKYFIETFTKWHNMLLELCDGVICISKTTADVVKRYYDSMKITRNKPLDIFFIHLGANFIANNIRNIARTQIMNFVRTAPCLLMVGTVEPRKEHLTALKATRQLIEDNRIVNLLILGKDGWKNQEFTNELENLPSKVKKHVLWIKDASDEEIRWAYKNAMVLVAASKDEGFGLPLVEAGYYGLPIICSDIPIFREIAGENAMFFKPSDSDDLSRTVSKWLTSDKHPDSRNIRIYSWNESAKEILNIIEGNVNPLYY